MLKLKQQKEYTDLEICDRMRHRVWVRECCEKVIQLTLLLQAGGPIVEPMRDFFITSWGDDLSRIACFNSFLQTSEYLMAMFDGLDDIAAGRRALAEDILLNVYAVWIPCLCSQTRAVANRANDIATRANRANDIATRANDIERRVRLPLNSWAVCYDKDPLIRRLETLYAACAPMAKTYESGCVLVRLNGEHQAL